MIYKAKFSISSLASTKQKDFLKLHGDGEHNNTMFAEFKAKKDRFKEAPVLGIVPINKLILTATYQVAYLSACFCVKLMFC